MYRCTSCGAEYEAEKPMCSACGAAPAQKPTHLAFPVREPRGYDPSLFARLAPLERSSFWFRSRNELIAWALRRYRPDAQSMLEVGCGTGVVLEALHATFPGLRLVGAELYDEGLAIAAERVPDAQLYRLDARSLPFTTEFDAIGLFDVLEHIEQDSDVLAEVHRALRPGGIVLITVPQHRRLWSGADDAAEHVRRYARSDLAAKLAATGFRLMRLTSFVSLLLPAMVASRLRARVGAESYDLEAELRGYGLLNPILERVMGVERALIRAGVNLPAGGSLLAVAERA